MLDKLAAINDRFNEIERLMVEPSTLADFEKVAKLAKERSDLQPVIEKYHEYLVAQQQLNDAKEMLKDADPDIRDFAQLELEEAKERIPTIEEELKVILLPKDPRDNKNVIIEVRAGTGGDEAGLFAADLYRMYTRYAEAHRFKYELLAEHDSGIGGFSMVKFIVKGDGAYSRYKYEGGVHRVQRVPETESQGRIHTSTATVAILAELDEVDVDINISDVRVDVYRSQGAGGQSVNTTDSAVRLTHIPSGIVVEMQDERSQLQNKLRAWQALRNRLYEMELEKQISEQEGDRRKQVGSGDRSEKIRTYNYPQSRVTDHRINYSSYNLPVVMDGKLDEFIDQLATQEQADKLAAV